MSRRTQHRRRRRARLRFLAIDPHCFYCGCWLTVEWSSVDHVDPLSKGGADEERNMVLSCRRCNGRKGSLPIEMVVVQRFQGCGLLARNHMLRLWEQALIESVEFG